jgi:hypothetical protein
MLHNIDPYWSCIRSGTGATAGANSAGCHGLCACLYALDMWGYVNIAPVPLCLLPTYVIVCDAASCYMLLCMCRMCLCRVGGRAVSVSASAVCLTPSACGRLRFHSQRLLQPAHRTQYTHRPHSNTAQHITTQYTTGHHSTAQKSRVKKKEEWCEEEHKNRQTGSNGRKWMTIHDTPMQCRQHAGSTVCNLCLMQLPIPVCNGQQNSHNQ